MDITTNIQRERWEATMSLLEDADSIQMGLGEVMRLLMTRQVDHRTAALMLYGLQTASANLKHTSFEPEPTRVVIDRDCVERRPIGATAWSTVEGREYDEVENDEVEKDELEKDEVDQEEAERGRAFMAELKRLSEGVARDPGYLDRRAGDLGGEQEKGIRRELIR
jgi:hypothetical protein